MEVRDTLSYDFNLIRADLLSIMAAEESGKRTVILEAYACDGKGSEAGIAERWIEALVSMPGIDKVIIVTKAPREPRSAKEEILLVPLPRFEQPLYRVGRGLPFSQLWGRFCFYLCYVCWLWKSSNACLELARAQRISLAVHCTYSGLAIGTFLWRLRKFAIRTVTCGVLVFPVPKAFHGYLTPLERCVLTNYRLINQCSRFTRSTDYVVASTRRTLQYLRSHPEKGQRILSKVDAVFPVRRQDKIRRVLYVDRPDVNRKCGQLLHEALCRNGGSPLPLLVLSKTPEAWREYPNVEASSYLNEPDFENALATSEFVLSTSARESGHTAILRGTSAGTIPILTDIDGYAAIPRNARLTIRTEGELVANILDVLKAAATLGQEESMELSLKTEAWGTAVSSLDSLTAILRYMIMDDSSSFSLSLQELD